MIWGWLHRCVLILKIKSNHILMTWVFLGTLKTIFFFFLNKGSLNVSLEELTSDRGRVKTIEYLPV